MNEGFFIGELSRKTGVPTQNIRYYEKLGLLEPPNRTDGRYRIYSGEDEARLIFIKQAKLFGLTLEEIKEIINLRAGGIAPCEHVKEIVERHLNDLNQHIQEMTEFRDELASRFEKLKRSDSDIFTGTICGFIERESGSTRQEHTVTDGRARQ